MRIGTPPIVDVCNWGIDMKKKDQFIALDRTEDEIANAIGATSVKYATMEELKTAIGMSDLCVECLGKNSLDFGFIKDSSY